MWKLLEAEVMQSCQNDTQMELTVPVDVFKTGFGASCVFMIRVPNRNRPSGVHYLRQVILKFRGHVTLVRPLFINFKGSCPD